MKKLQQIAALTGVVLLAGMYVLAFIFSLSHSPKAEEMLLAALYCTVVVPVFLYAFLLVYRLTRGQTDPTGTTVSGSADKKPVIDTFIFDLGNVLVSYDWQALLKNMKYNPEAIRAVGDAMFESPDWPEADRGVRNEEEILQAFIENDPEYEKEIRAAFSRLDGAIRTFSYTVNWIKHLKQKGYKVYYLSNFSQPMFEQCGKKMKFLELMDGGYMSWQVKLLKPEPEFYQKLLQDFNIDPQKAIFIDDVMDNIAEARAQGIHAIHFEDRKSTLRKLSEEYGIR